MVLKENDNGGAGGSGAGVWLDESHEEHDDGSLSQFKPMLAVAGDWFSNSPPHDLQTHQDFRFLDGFRFNQNDNLLLQHSIDSSSSCSPSQTFNFDPLQHQEQSFLATNPYVASFLSVPSANPFNNAFEFSSQSDILRHLHGNQSMDFSGLSSGSDLSVLAPENRATLRVSEFTTPGVETVTNGGFGNRAKVLKPLEVLPSSGSQPTLFQKRAAMRQNSGTKLKNSESSEMRKLSDKGVMDKTKIEISGYNYESYELNERFKAAESVQNGGNKGKKKGMPAKNLMAERRRRKKLNDRLYMLRSVVPKISKMDRASILGDAVDYLMELLQRINNLHKELDSNPQTLSSFHPLTPTPQMLLPSRVREELCTSSLSSPKDQQARVEVRVREGRAVNINMFCGRKAGLLLATMRALDNLGLDVQQAVISCFNGFSLDVFRAECEEGRDILPEQIKAVLLDTVGYAAVI